ncbi:hypothetical protein FH972_015755 [Carpinus fangiana]|uniref:Auxin-responsive protein n=1 Tax=Carpinus fangiana TaxID=176857 RepID=A0A5N6RDQ4_9ROSI|nr:hypothetical protein FH972_015755 [Carpinus fangiana]
MDEREDVSTDLKLGLSTSSFDENGVSASLRQQPLNDLQDRPSLFIKVFMDGIPIGRKVNVFAQNEYDSLIRTINIMFPTTNIYSGADRVHSEKYHVLIYEDMEGDWLMVGDVPWE